MRYYCVEMGGTVKSVRCGTVRWLGAFGCECTATLRWIVQICTWWSPCENLLMVDSMWKSAHVGIPYGNLPMLGTPCGNLLMMGTPLYSSLQFSMSKSDEIIALCTLKIACTAEIIHISVFCATIFSEYGLTAGLANF
ncbi:hypothetical protein [Paenibacillus odorifer]|uniref:hypothetical protein n=1 Tax=Paenibacillus odorifer TaxID=189426 RepID=UPI0028963940|nr:hypothetical protein [Paenibacillus odorifer]